MGKTTLLAMFYRQASTGQVPGLRLAAVDPPSAEYLAEKIAQIESGEPPAGTLAETELKLRLYHGPARFDLIFKDYQGEHVTLGTDEPIQAFFADCDAVLLCLDPEGSTQPAERRRRQQEVENLLERYIDRSDDGTAGRPVALLLTKFDRVLARGEGGQGLDQVERLVEARYGMTRHALARHVPNGAMFAVSAYGRGAVDGRPPHDLQPLGLEGPLVWLAEQLEEVDREQLEWLWDLAPDDLPRLARCVVAFEKRYPRSDRSADFRRRLSEGRRRKSRRALVKRRLDARGARRRARGVRLLGLSRRRPLRPGGQPRAGRRPTVGRPDPVASLAPLLLALRREARPGLARRVDRQGHRHPGPRGHRRPRCRRPARPLEGAVSDPGPRHPRRREGPGAGEAGGPLDRGQAPRPPASPTSPTPRSRPSNGSSASSPTPRIGARPTPCSSRSGPGSTPGSPAASARSSTTSSGSSNLPNANVPDLIEQARQFLVEHPESRLRPEADRLLDDLVKTLDDRDIEKARDFSRRSPTEFAKRIDRYGDYLKAHANGGRHISEAIEAKDRILRAWDDRHLPAGL